MSRIATVSSSGRRNSSSAASSTHMLAGVAGQHGMHEPRHCCHDRRNVTLHEEPAHVGGQMARVDGDLAVGLPLRQQDRRMQRGQREEAKSDRDQFAQRSRRHRGETEHAEVGQVDATSDRNADARRFRRVTQQVSRHGDLVRAGDIGLWIVEVRSYVTDVSASTSETDTPISAATAQSIRAVTMGRRSTGGRNGHRVRKYQLIVPMQHLAHADLALRSDA